MNSDESPGRVLQNELRYRDIPWLLGFAFVVMVGAIWQKLMEPEL